MMWAGANPRAPGPDLDDRYADDPECHTTALKEACYKGKLDVLKKFKPDPTRDNLSELLHAAALSESRDLIEYLLGLGAQPNDRPNGGSSALDTCLWHLPCPAPRPGVDTTDASDSGLPVSQFYGCLIPQLYNNVRLNSATGYITPKDMLAGRQHEIHAERDRKLEAARQQRRDRRRQAA